MADGLAVAHDLDPAGLLDHEQVPVVAGRLGDVDGLVEVADLLKANAALPVAGGQLPVASIGLAGGGRRRCGGRGRASASPHPASTTTPMTMRGGSGRQPRRKPRTALRYWPGFKDG